MLAETVVADYCIPTGPEEDAKPATRPLIFSVSTVLLAYSLAAIPRARSPEFGGTEPRALSRARPPPCSLRRLCNRKRSMRSSEEDFSNKSAPLDAPPSRSLSSLPPVIPLVSLFKSDCMDCRTKQRRTVGEGKMKPARKEKLDTAEVGDSEEGT